MYTLDTEYYLDMVSEFRAATALPMNSGDACNHALHMDLFASENREFLTAETEAQRADGLADMLVIWAGYQVDGTPPVPFSLKLREFQAWANHFRINLLGAFQVVHESLMTKVCKAEDVEPTRQKYEALGMEVEFRETVDGRYGCFCVKDPHGALGEVTPPGKLLKPTCYRSPDWVDDTRWKRLI